MPFVAIYGTVINVDRLVHIKSTRNCRKWVAVMDTGESMHDDNERYDNRVLFIDVPDEVPEESIADHMAAILNEAKGQK